MDLLNGLWHATSEFRHVTCYESESESDVPNVRLFLRCYCSNSNLIRTSFSFVRQEKYKRNGGKAPDGIESDKMVFEIVRDFFPKALKKADRAINFGDSDDDEDSEVQGITFSDVGDPIKVEHIRKDDGAFESTESDQEQDEMMTSTIADKETDRMDENVWSMRNNDALQLSASSNHTADAMKMEMAEMQNYKMKLELIKMERELYLKPSKYTKDIVASQGLPQRW